MNRKCFWSLLAYDMSYGLYYNRTKWLFALLIQIYFCVLAGSLQTTLDTEVGFWGCLTNLFRGLPEYHISETGKFELPIPWLVFHAFLLFLVGFYPAHDLSYSGGQAFIRAGNRKYWLCSKVIWTLATVLSYYLMLAVVLLVCSMLTGGVETSSVCVQRLLGGDFANTSLMDILIYWWWMPMLTSAALCVIEVILSLFIEPVLSFLAMFSILVASVFWMTPWLIGNFSMLLRMDFVSGNQCISFANCLIGCSMMICASCALGTSAFNLKDIFFLQGGQE